MKSHRDTFFSSWTEDALIDSLEDRLHHTSESEDPFPLVRPILDALDQKAGAVPFDLETNWNALYPGHQKKRLPFGMVLTAALLFLCAALCGLASMFGLHEKLATFFHAEGPQASLLLPLTDEPEASVQTNGITVNVLQTITDTMGIYVLYEITVPDNVTLPDNVVYVDNLLIPSFPLDSQDRLGGSGGSEVLECSPHRVLVFSYTVENNNAPLDLPIRLYFPPTTTLRSQEGETLFTLWQAEEPVVLEWQCTPVNAVESWSPDTPVQNGDYHLTKVLLSPVSLIFFLDGVPAPPDPEPVTLSFADGTTLSLDSGTLDGNHIRLDSETGRMRHQYLYRFSSPIDLASVDAITIGEITVEK